MLPVHYDQNELYEITMNSFYQADEKAYLIPRKIRSPFKVCAFNFRASNFRAPSDFAPL